MHGDCCIMKQVLLSARSQRNMTGVGRGESMDYSKPPKKPPVNFKHIYFSFAWTLCMGLGLWAVGGSRYHEGASEHIAETEHGPKYVPERTPGHLTDGVMMVSGAVISAGCLLALAGTGIAHLSSRMRSSE
jgi:hypothetical protein